MPCSTTLLPLGQYYVKDDLMDVILRPVDVQNFIINSTTQSSQSSWGDYVICHEPLYLFPVGGIHNYYYTADDFNVLKNGICTCAVHVGCYMFRSQTSNRCARCGLQHFHTTVDLLRANKIWEDYTDIMNGDHDSAVGLTEQKITICHARLAQSVVMAAFPCVWEDLLNGPTAGTSAQYLPNGVGLRADGRAVVESLVRATRHFTGKRRFVEVLREQLAGRGMRKVEKYGNSTSWTADMFEFASKVARLAVHHYARERGFLHSDK